MNLQKDVNVNLPLVVAVLSGSLEVLGSTEIKPENSEVKRLDKLLSLFQISYEIMLEIT